MRERLVELLNKKYDHFCDQCGVNKDSHYTDSLADYLLENGVVVLPCKVGTRVYMVLDRYDARKLGCSCCLADYGFETECAYYKSGDCTNMTANANWQIISRRFEYQHIYDFGKTVFLTREEAERALKGGAE
jgi:hypothetical protein